MLKIKFTWLFLLIVVVATAQTNSAFTLFNDNWEFIKNADSVVTPQAFINKKDTWEKVSLPHTASIEPVVISNKPWQGICWYRKFFFIRAINPNKKMAVYFEAAMHEADMYLNGKLLKNHKGGYLPFEVDITNDVKQGENCLLVKLDNRDNPQIPPGKPTKDLDFVYYSGIYRNAYWVETDKLYIPDAVTYNKTAEGGLLFTYDEVNKQKAVLNIKTTITNSFAANKKASIKISLLDKNGKQVQQSISNTITIQQNNAAIVQQQITIASPFLWSPNNPYLYTIKAELISNGKVLQTITEKTGVRTIRFEKDAFYINGERLRIRGTNRHQEYPYIGNALPDHAQYRDAYKIKEAGFNFVRTSHYPQSPAFLQACDELGILVMASIPGWQFYGDNVFEQASYQTTKDMLRRDRNHPSIILWEASLNETQMPQTYTNTQHAIVHGELPAKDVYSCGWVKGVYDVFIPARQHQKPPNFWRGYNENIPLFFGEYGDWEYYAMNAGFNQTDFQNLKETERTSRQLRGDGEKRLLQQALNYQESHNDNFNTQSVGDANWLMFDYNRGYAPDIESSGIMDIFRLPKFAFYFYQSQNSPKSVGNNFEKPMIFIASYHNEQSPLQVKVYSNCNEVELKQNNQLIARQKADTGHLCNNLHHPPFTFQLKKFEGGTLVATGFINGKQVVSTKQSTPGKATALKLSIDYSGKPVAKGRKDVLFVYASVTDVNGTVIPTDEREISFSIKGNATIIGNSTVKAEAGIATILIETSGKKGTITISALHEELRSGYGEIVLK